MQTAMGLREKSENLTMVATASANTAALAARVLLAGRPRT